MGHANLTNISQFFVNWLYAKGALSIADCAKALVAAGETLHASEGQYEDEEILMIGLADVVDYLALENPRRYGYTGPDGNVGPHIVPVLDVWLGNRSRLTPAIKVSLRVCESNRDDQGPHEVAADQLSEAGLEAWSAHVRGLLRSRVIYLQWVDEQAGNWDTEEYEIFDAIPWRFAKWWRTRYRDVPILSNVTH